MDASYINKDSNLKPSKIKHVFKLSDLPEERYGDAGELKLINKTAFPALKGLGLFWGVLDNDGILYPHWHPNADELVYCVKGKGTMAVVSPDNEVERFEFQAGDLLFFPRGSFHYFESIGSDRLEFLAIFNSEMPEYMGIVNALAGIPDKTLGSVFKVPSETFSKFNKKDTLLAKQLEK